MLLFTQLLTNRKSTFLTQRNVSYFLNNNHSYSIKKIVAVIVTQFLKGL